MSDLIRGLTDVIDGLDCEGYSKDAAFVREAIREIERLTAELAAERERRVAAEHRSDACCEATEKARHEWREATKAGTPYWHERDAMNNLVVQNQRLSGMLAAAGTGAAVPGEGELAPCPFCGGKASYGGSFGKRDYAYAGCMKCRIHAKADVVKPVNDLGPGYAMTAIAAWNRRVSPPPRPAAIDDQTHEALRVACSALSRYNTPTERHFARREVEMVLDRLSSPPAAGAGPAIEPACPAAIVTFRRSGTDHAELFAVEGDGINRYEQVEADNVRVLLASKDSIRWRFADSPGAAGGEGAKP